MKKEIKLVLLITFSIFLSIIINIFFFSDFDIKFLSKNWHKNQTISYNVNDQTKINLTQTNNDTYITTSDDSQIIAYNINGNVNDANFSINSSCKGNMQAYYTVHKDDDFQEKYSMNYDINEGNNDYHILISNNIYDLRIDPVNGDNCSISISNISVNYSKLSIFQFMNFDKIFIISIIILFIFINLFYDRKKLYSFMFDKRILIGATIVFVAVLFKYNGSSFLLYNEQVQPNTKIANQSELFGQSRSIRSDEWNVSTPISLSQLSGDKKLGYFSNNFRAEDTDMYVNTSAPVLDIVGISKPFTWGYFIFGAERGFSFWWVARFVALFLVSIEFGMLITKKNKKLSLALAFLLTLAPAVQWWYSTSIVELIVFGQLSVLLVNKLFESKSKKTKFISASCLIISMLGFFASLYPAWEVPLAIVYGLIGLYYFVNNIKKNKITKFDIAMIIYVIIVVGLILLRFYYLSKDTINIISSTVYPGNRFKLGGNGLLTLLNYYPGIIYPFIKILNPCEPSMFISLFPIPVIIGIVLTIKNKNKNYLMIILLSILSLYSLYSIIGFPKWLATITLTYLTTTGRMNVIIHLLCIYLMIISLSETKTSIMNKNNKYIYLALIVVYLVLLFLLTNSLNVELYSIKGLIFLIIIISLYLIIYLKSDKNNNKLFLLATIFISLMSGLFVNPIIKGTNIITDKPYAKEVRKLQEEDSGKWIVIGSSAVQNYTAVQGAPVINTVNLYPDLQRMKLIDPDNKYEDIYNRYAHISVELTEEETTFKLIQADFYVIYLNINDLSKLDVKYIVSHGKIEYDTLNIEQLYYEDGLYIYKLK